MIRKQDIVKNIINHSKLKELNITNSEANINFAIIKYWGKKNEELMIPSIGSISISPSGFLGTRVKIYKSNKNILTINNMEYNENTKEFINCFTFVELFRLPFNLKIETQNTINTANGLASSASAFAAITKGILSFFEENFTQKEQSIIARLGSVSASRSIITSNFVKLVQNEEYSYSEEIKTDLKLYFCIANISSEVKYISSREAMRISIANSNEYEKWLEKNEEDLQKMEILINKKDIKNIHKLIIENSENLSNLMKNTGINYDKNETIILKKKIKELYNNGFNISFTQDAGPNIKIISEDRGVLREYFPNLEIF